MTALFPAPALSETEMAIVASNLSDPAVVKYFQLLAHNQATQILQMYSESNESEKFLRVIASMQGQISVLQTLLQISGDNLGA